MGEQAVGQNVDLPRDPQTDQETVPAGMDAAGGKWRPQDAGDASLPKTSGAAASAAPGEHALVEHYAQRAASLSFFSARIFSFTVAGLAANHCSSLVNGLMPLRFGLAGTLTAVIFSRPGMVK